MRRLVSGQEPGVAALRIAEAADPVPGPGDVLITVHHAALNFPDLLLVQDRYQIRAPRPFTPGSEVSGVVRAVGPGVSSFAPGDRVIALMRWGGMAELVTVSASQCVHLPEGAPADAAAGLLFTYSTALYGLEEGGVAAGETVLVLGASGGVGQAAVELAKALGARVVAAVSSEEKAALARRSGADETVIYGRPPFDRVASKALADAFKQACGPGGCNVVIDPVGGDYSEPAFRALGWAGRHVVLGFTAGIPALPLNLALLCQRRVIGVAYVTATERDPAVRQRIQCEVVRLFAAGAICPAVTARYPLDQAMTAFAAMAARQVTGKVLIDIAAKADESEKLFERGS